MGGGPWAEAQESLEKILANKALSEEEMKNMSRNTFSLDLDLLSKDKKFMAGLKNISNEFLIGYNRLVRLTDLKS